MKIPMGRSVSRSFPVTSSLRVEKTPLNIGPRGSVKKFIADLRTNYQERKKNKLPMEKKQRQLSIGYFILAFVVIMMIQNYYGRAHVDVISYSQFKSLVKKDLVNDLVIRVKRSSMAI